MDYLSILRQLADQQQYPALNSAAQHYWHESADVQVLPLLALSHAYLNARVEAEAALAQAENFRAEFDTDARVDLAGVYCVLLRIDEAVTLLEAALLVDTNHSLALARLAWCRMRLGQLNDACRLYQISAELVPNRLPVWSALARLYLEAGDTPAAQQALDQAIGRLEQLATNLPEPAVALFTAQFRGLQLEVWLAGDNIGQAEQWLNERQQDLTEAQWTALMRDFSTLLAGHERHAEAEESLRSALKYYPTNLELISQLAELAQLQGRTGQAVQLLRRAIRLAPEQDKVVVVGLWLRLAGACLHQLDEQGRKAAEKAAKLANELEECEATPLPMIQQLRLQAKNALAQVESQAQNFELAESLFRSVLDEHPWFLPALQGLGQQQMQRGQIDEAIKLFERIKMIDPVKGYSSLINARRFPDDEETLKRIEKAARQPSLEGAVHSGLLLQLASAWEKCKNHDKAFELAVQANESSKKRLAYDPKGHRQSCARMRHAFSPALYQHRRDCGYRGADESLPVFILGMPRSGTTLVEQILAGHSAIFGAGELGVIPNRIQGMRRWERHTGSERRYPDCIDDLNPYVTNGIAKGILNELKELAANDKPNARHVVDKLPHNFENIGFIKFLFPQAKIISVRRDPRDIAISNYFTDYQAKYGGMGFAYDLSWIGEQLSDHNLMLHHWNQLFPGEILEINYEDVVEDTEAMARKMLDYIGVEWEPQVLAFNELDRPVKTASVWQVRQPIYKTSTAKWLRYQNHLSPLLQGTNAKIVCDPIEDMLTLPEPGLLQEGVALYKDEKLDEAEYSFKKMLHHNPEHGAANYMVGLIYCRKGHIADAIPLMEKALEKCPWKKAWRKDLMQAYEMTGEQDKLAELQARFSPKGQPAGETEAEAHDAEMVFSNPLAPFSERSRMDN